MNKKGFAVSGILYTILLIFLAIIYMLLMNFKNKKNLLDQLKSEVLFNSKLCEEKVGQTFTFDYTGDVQEFIAPCNGYYKLEVWGAEGGSYNSTYHGGYGGYSTGNIVLNKNEKISIVVGGEGQLATSANGTVGTAKGGYNGGGSSRVLYRSDGITRYGGSGGGATHIAKEIGLLSELEQFKGNYSSTKEVYESDKILIVAAGGGGWGGYNGDTIYSYLGANAGGYKGNSSGGTGATQSSPGYSWYSSSKGLGSFGQGGSNSTTASSVLGGAGGGGFYGGGSVDDLASEGGGGGSGYIANPNLTNKSMYCYNCTTSNDVATKTESTTCTNATAIANCSKEGNGYAKITYLGDLRRR